MNPTLRFRKARNSADQLGQVFTPPAIASLLAKSLAVNSKSIVDVGAGMGALAVAALQQCKKAEIILIEKDEKYAEKLLNLNIANSKILSENALATGVLEKVISPLNKPVILSNPPYGMLKLSDEINLDIDSELPPVLYGGWVRGDAAFLSKIWSVSKTGSSLGLIVASAIICGKPYESYRKRLVEEISGLTITQLHPRTFAKTEVQAFLISGRKSTPGKRKVILRQADPNGNITNEIYVSQREAVERLDFAYHSTAKELKLGQHKTIGTLSELGGKIVRGSQSQNIFKKLGLAAFHTTDFTTNPKNLTLHGAVDGFKSAHQGDILIPRVGSRCLIREARVVSGSGLITDCIYRIRVPDIFHDRVWNTLNSDFGREWRKLISRGSCAKYITMNSLGELPILL
ncbi:N-6 DNA methylase [Pseudomonas asplenii]|uniref:N-6 DNA methylase n=1 Tax=Pseudomonas asplenii TaxID=53407 RepID=UPI00235EE169|nr:N-6 DNA methylase [Pseudomonas asplenii]